jgi:ABC-type transporter Mla MlaB component
MGEASEKTEIVLSGTADISSAVELHGILSSALEAGLPVSIDSAEVQRVDTAVLQLLIAFSREAKERGLALSWKEVGASLRDSANFLDLSRFLELPEMADSVKSRV